MTPNQTPRLGILGGMGPEATQVFYRRILARTEAACDQEHVPALIWSDSSIPDRTAALLHGQGERLYAHLRGNLRLLEGASCTVIAIPCNTSHYFLDRLQGETDMPILHMLRLTAARLRAMGKTRPGILATDGTVQLGLYQAACEGEGLRPLLPPPDVQALVMSLIYDEIKAGKPGNPDAFQRIDDALRALGCDCAVLGCTELSVFRHTHGLPPFYVDAMELLAEEAILRCGRTLRA